MNLLCIRPLPGAAGAAAATLLLAALVAGPLQAQQGTVAGQVTDKVSQQPVPGAQVVLVGTSLQARTSREGRYEITKVPVGQYSVQVRLIGYATTTQSVSVSAGGPASVDFTLNPAAISLEEVVISATGAEQLKRELGNSVATLDATKVTEQAAPSSAADLLNSRVAGVEVYQTSGTTGGGDRVRIRGATSLSLQNEPIIVVDGVRLDNTAQADGGIGVGGQAPSRINDINPNDVESVEIVKGPSAAALYGTDAANGVIVYRTKQGRPGPTKWQASLDGGTLNDETTWPANYFSKTSAGASCRLSSQARGLCTIAAVDSFNPLMQNPPFREGVRQHYLLSAQGGNEITTFYVSGDFQREKGIYESNDLRKTSLRANLTNQVSRLMDIRANVAYVTSNLNLPQNDNNDQGLLPSGLLGFPNSTAGGYRFLTPAEANAISTTQRIERFNGGITANFRPASFLTMHGTAGYDITNQGDNELTPPNVIPLDQTRLDGNVFQYRAQIFSYTGNFSTEAAFRLSPIITSKTTVGVQYYKHVFQQVQASGRKVVAGTGALSGAVIPTVGDTTAPAVTLGGYIEENLSLRDRLFIIGALRDDEHSAFGVNFGKILYPKLSASWVVSEEPFFPRIGWLQSLRVRAAWGKSGRAPGVLDALQFYRPVAVTTGATDVPAITIGGAGNTDLKPEQTREIEAGFDADMLNSRLHLEATYYDKDSKDGLVAVPIAGSVGVSSTRLANLGEITNKGIELVVKAQLVNTPNVVWNVTASGWGNKNRVLSTGPGNTPIIFGLGGATQRLQVGYPAGGYWGRAYKFTDANNDKLLNPLTEITYDTADTFQGSPFPTRGATFSTEVTFLHRFTLYGLLDGRWGNKLDNATESFRCLFGICAGIRLPGTSLADQAAAQAALLGYETGYYQDAGFLKLRELSLSYSAPAQWAAHVGASSLRFTVLGRNLATWTNYRGVDPEVNTIGQFNYSTAEFLTQPPVRQFTARVDLTY
jgi:TonB-linked SusC/RagA family outer membrane protein